MDKLTKLPNGAEILKTKKINGEYLIYLCYWQGRLNKYITWQANVASPSETYWGHYFDNEADAQKDFQKRGHIF